MAPKERKGNTTGILLEDFGIILVLVLTEKQVDKARTFVLI